MKKILITSAVAAASVFTLVSCRSNKKTEAYIDSRVDTAIKSEYLGAISFDEVNFVNKTAVDSLAASGKDHFEVMLPTNVDASKYVNIMDISAADSVYDKVNVLYASTYAWSDKEYEGIIDVLKTDETLNAFEKKATEMKITKEYLDSTEAESRTLVVTYLPVEAVYVKYNKKKEIKQTITSYVLVPVYSALTTKTNGVVADTEVASLPTITFTVKKSVIL